MTDKKNFNKKSSLFIFITILLLVSYTIWYQQSEQKFEPRVHAGEFIGSFDETAEVIQKVHNRLSRLGAYKERWLNVRSTFAEGTKDYKKYNDFITEINKAINKARIERNSLMNKLRENIKDFKKFKDFESSIKGQTLDVLTATNHKVGSESVQVRTRLEEIRPQIRVNADTRFKLQQQLDKVKGSDGSIPKEYQNIQEQLQEIDRIQHPLKATRRGLEIRKAMLDAKMSAIDSLATGKDWHLPPLDPRLDRLNKLISRGGVIGETAEELAKRMSKLEQQIKGLENNLDRVKTLGGVNKVEAQNIINNLIDQKQAELTDLDEIFKDPNFAKRASSLTGVENVKITYHGKVTTRTYTEIFTDPKTGKKTSRQVTETCEKVAGGKWKCAKRIIKGGVAVIIGGIILDQLLGERISQAQGAEVPFSGYRFDTIPAEEIKR